MELEEMAEIVASQITNREPLSIPGYSFRVGKCAETTIFPEHEDELCVDFWDNGNNTTTVFLSEWADEDAPAFPEVSVIVVPNSEELDAYYESIL